MGWLAGSILQRIEPFKRYPAAARIEKLEGRVVVRAVILADGQLASSDIAKSSGHDILDQAALEAVRQAAPFVLTQQLGRERVTIHIPLSYTLGR
ncbi:MAG: energy transducer TonB [Nitrospiraceae bacterium]|nr:energy transducer TonB [Nitrospiraceae bacterium]